MKSIIDKVIDSIKDAFEKKLAVYYHNEKTLNLVLDNADFPCAIVYLIERGDVVEENGVLKEKCTFAVHFIEPSEFDFNSIENEEIISRCKERCFEWIYSLNRNADIEIENVINSQRSYEAFDAILTGFGVLIEIKELTGICIKK